MLTPENIFANMPPQSTEEVLDVLLQRPGVRIERIVSTGQCSPDGFWYDQEWHEWVLVLSGHGVVELEDGERVRLRKGDHLFIPAHCKHRVAETAEKEPTVWLAVHFAPE